MFTSAFDYKLPASFIAQSPTTPRDSSRLMVVDRQTRKIEHRIFRDIRDYLKKGNLLVWNNSKVFKARLLGKIRLDKEIAGLKDVDSTEIILNAPPVEIFLLRPMENNKVWKTLAKPGRKLRAGMKIVFAEDFAAEVVAREADGTFLMEFNEDDLCVRAKANKYGLVPLPPYIKGAIQGSSMFPSPYRGGAGGGVSQSKDERRDPHLCLPPLRVKKLGEEIFDQYQTVYAKHEGSVAAPTAGFHFTPELIGELEEMGVQFAEVTLHVGLGTFQPVKTEYVEEHKMHSEWVELTAKNADLINAAKVDGRRVVAVGTTTVRVLEGIAAQDNNLAIEQFNNEWKRDKRYEIGDRMTLKPYSGDINLFITPGFEFKVVDALITNFHLPKSTLLMLVSAFVKDTDFMLQCYREAIKENYRFYSFGDAMFVI